MDASRLVLATSSPCGWGLYPAGAGRRLLGSTRRRSTRLELKDNSQDLHKQAQVAVQALRGAQRSIEDYERGKRKQPARSDRRA